MLLDDDGLFNVELSDAAGSAIEGLDQELDAVIAAHAGATLYIGLTVQGSSGEIRPRQKILSVPLASYAYDVSLAKRDFTVTGKATFNATETTGNAVVNGTNTVKTLSVTDGAVLAGDVRVTGELNLTGGSLAMPSDATFTIGGVSAVLPKGVIVMWSGVDSLGLGALQRPERHARFARPFHRGGGACLRRGCDWRRRKSNLECHGNPEPYAQLFWRRPAKCPRQRRLL